MKRVPSFATKRTDSVVFAEQPRDRLETKLIIIMVGLPARGKSYISKKLKRWMNWMGIHTRVFNVGNARRSTTQEPQDSSFFNPNDARYSNIRELIALDVLNELLYWLRVEGSVGIHDATNSTRKRRETLLKHLENEPDTNVLFIESLCTDNDVIETNIRMKAKSPDYIAMDPTVARKDFIARLANYEQSYQEIDETDKIPYVKVINVGERIIANRVKGYLESQIVFYLMNIHISPRNIYLVLHGENEYNVQGRMGGDSPLTERGKAFSQHLVTFFKNEFGLNEENGAQKVKSERKKVEVWTSMLGSAVQTAKFFRDSKFKVFKTRNLNALDTGYLTGYTESEVEDHFFEEYKNLLKDPFAYRFPSGESYLDVIDRAKTLIIELERIRQDVVIISHKSVMRVVYAYFMEIPPQQIPYLDIPRQTVIKLTPSPHGCEELRVHINEQQTNVQNSMVRLGNVVGVYTAEVLFSLHYESIIGEELHVLTSWGDSDDTQKEFSFREEDHRMIWSPGHFWQLRAMVPLLRNSITLLRYNYQMKNSITGLVRYETEGQRTLYLPPLTQPCSASILLKDSWDVIVHRDLTAEVFEKSSSSSIGAEI